MHLFGVKGAFDTVVANLQHIKEAAPDLPLTVHWSVLEHNAHELPYKKRISPSNRYRDQSIIGLLSKTGGTPLHFEHSVTPDAT